jgi:flagellar biosynthesis/type III secretory pathway chaperone
VRNTLQYPITKEEVKAVLETVLMRERDDDRVGSIDGMVLQQILKQVDILLWWHMTFGSSEHFE